MKNSLIIPTTLIPFLSRTMAVKCFEVYVLALFVVAYLLNQLDRYILAVVNIPLSQELEYGDKACQVNHTATSDTNVVCNSTSEAQ